MLNPPPAALISRNPLQWLRIFGPGAIVASLTIGTGELIFSSRGGALFGYSILFPFLVVCVLKWTLAYSAARHMVLSGAHPFQRWADLPLGPAGWLPALFAVLAAGCIPIWVSFHASVLGDLFAVLTATKSHLGGASIHVWGAAALIGVLLLALRGGYAALETTQLVVVGLMLAAVTVALFLFGPDWGEFLGAFITPTPLRYASWVAEDPRPAVRQLVATPIWAELSLYVGVIGGSSYDYLAYAAFLRDKGWGLAGKLPGEEELRISASASNEPDPALDLRTLRQWTRAPLIDCTLSFLMVLAFSGVFVAAGTLVLAPRRQLPGDGAFLEHQAQFVTGVHPWLYPLYVFGVLLAMLGTLYGTLEILPVILREGLRALRPDRYAACDAAALRRRALLWCGGVALGVLAVSFAYQWQAGPARPPGLTALLAPVNLFTGVFGCGVVCLMTPWAERSLPQPLRLPAMLMALNVFAAAAFFAVGLRSYWEYAGWIALLVLAGTLTLGFAAAACARRWPPAPRKN